jgi:hypothetical protein
VLYARSKLDLIDLWMVVAALKFAHQTMRAVVTADWVQVEVVTVQQLVSLSRAVVAYWAATCGGGSAAAVCVVDNTVLFGKQEVAAQAPSVDTQTAASSEAAAVVVVVVSDPLVADRRRDASIAGL